MKLIGVVAVVGVLAVAGGAGSAGAKTAKQKPCVAGFTESRTASNLTVTGDTCRSAQDVASRVTAIAPQGCIKVLNRKGRIGFRRPCAQLRYTCTATSINAHKGLSVKCVRGARVIRFRY